MRKILIGIIIILLAIGTYMFLINGVSLGKLKVYGVKEIQSLGKTLDDKVNKASELVNIDFNNANKNLNNSLTELQSKRKEYENKIATSNPEDIKNAMTTETHEIQFLWTKLGNYATKNGLKLTLDLKNSSAGVANEKDLDFTIEGSYLGVTNFLYSIEDDEKLEFRVEDFKLIPVSVTTNNGEQATTTSSLQAKFSVKAINVNLS